jgi:hypothetical protein
LTPKEITFSGPTFLAWRPSARGTGSRAWGFGFHPPCRSSSCASSIPQRGARSVCPGGSGIS